MLSYQKLVLNFIILFLTNISADMTTEMKLLNELSVEKLMQIKNSLKGIEMEYDNFTITSPSYTETFGAQALAMRAPVKRTDVDEGVYKKDSESKISNIFSMSVTTLAFLAFGGYLLCLIVHAIKSKQNSTVVTTTQSTFFLNAGIKRPQTQFASYGRRKRDLGVRDIDIPPEQLFSALVHMCEGYAKWSKENNM